MRITLAHAEAIDRVRPLWLALHAHHQSVMADTLAPYADDAESWLARRAMYARFLEGDDPASFLLLAEDGEELVGYAMVAVTPVDDTWVGDTWRTGDRIAEIETLSVAPARRGEGIGSALLEAIAARLDAAGVADVVVGAIAANTGAIRFYERHGFRAASVYLSRFAGR